MARTDPRCIQARMARIEKLRAQAARAGAVVGLAVLYGIARLPSISSHERQQLAAKYRFASAPLPQVVVSSRTIRDVRASLQPIRAWISSVGAGVALHDIDGDGLPNDVCYVDVRSDTVVVAPVPR